MSHQVEVVSPETVPLLNAVLCVDCELVTSSRSNECPVCGGRSLLSLANIIGGTLVEYRGSRFQQQRPVQFDLHIRMDLSQLEGGELSAVIEGLSRVAAPMLARNGASLHINVDPVAKKAPSRVLAA
jgi:hypothetical protein